ncbi:MAG: hypothetical protein LBV64_06765 [Mediterranea sp.]|jgi:hypothetical protein|nr:hypothetical protein [Mediterranea sp.]
MKTNKNIKTIGVEFARLIASFSKVFLLYKKIVKVKRTPSKNEHGAKRTPNSFTPEEETNIREMLVAYKGGKNIPDFQQVRAIDSDMSVIEFVDKSGENKKITIKDLMFRGRSKPKNYFNKITKYMEYTPIGYNCAMLEGQRVTLHFDLQLPGGDIIKVGNKALQLPDELRHPDGIYLIVFVSDSATRNTHLAEINSEGELYVHTLLGNDKILYLDVTYYVPSPAEIYFDVNSSALRNITGDVNDEAICRILSRAGRCLVKKTGDGQVTICRLKADDSTKYWDETDAVLTGEEGDVMVYLPEFWYKSESNNTILTVSFREKAKDGYIHVPASLIGAYKACIETDNKAYSHSDALPTTSVSPADFISYAQARGKGYNVIDYYQHCQIALLFYAKYGNRSSQTILGIGNATIETETGGTNSLGNIDTKNTSSGWVNFIGIEGVHGGFDEYVSGVTVQDHVWTISDIDSDVPTRTITAGNTEGFITHVAAEAGGYFDMIPTAVNGGSATTYYADYYCPDTGNSSILVRSSNSTDDKGGVAYVKACLLDSEAYENVGSRLSFRGDIVEAQSVVAFKEIPLS